MAMLTTTRNALKYLGDDASTDTWLLYRNGYADAFQVIDAALAKTNFLAATDPTTNDDEGDGYASGSLWFNLTDSKIFVCEDASTSAAVWRQVWPAIVDDMDLTDYLLADGSQALGSALILTQIATPDAPAAGLAKLYAKLDNQMYHRPTGGSETLIVDASNLASSIAAEAEITLGGTLIFPEETGDIEAYYGDLIGVASGYARGIEASTIYWRSHLYFRWYIDCLADGGTSDSMQLSSAGLDVVGRITRTGPGKQSLLAKTANYTITDTDPDIVVVGALSAHATITLPTALDNSGRIITVIIDGDPGAYNVIVDGEGSETINGAATKTNSDQYSYLTLLSNGTRWNIIGSAGTWT